MSEDDSMLVTWGAIIEKVAGPVGHYGTTCGRPRMVNNGPSLFQRTPIATGRKIERGITLKPRS